MLIEQFIIDLESHLDNIDQSCVFLHPDLVLEDVITDINIVIDTHMPLVTLSRKSPGCTKSLGLRKEFRFQFFIEISSTKNIYKTKMNKILQFTKLTEITYLKDLSRQNYYKHLLIASEGKSSRIWTVINQLLSKNKRIPSSIVSPLKIDEKLITDSKHISNAFAHQFSNVGINISEKIATTNQHYNET